jgi:hypothetical protein
LNWRVLTMPIDISPAAIPAGADAALPLPGDETRALPQAPEHAGSFPQTLARPLFRSDRRPRDIARPDATASVRTASVRPQAPPPDVELIGIIKEGRGAGRALIRSGQEPTGSWVQLGQELQGWRLSRIDARSIVLEADGRQVQLSLKVPGD